MTRLHLIGEEQILLSWAILNKAKSCPGVVLTVPVSGIVRTMAILVG